MYSLTLKSALYQNDCNEEHKFWEENVRFNIFFLHMPMLNWMFNSSSRFIFCEEMFSSEEVCMDALILYDPPLKRGRGPSFEKKLKFS